MNTSSNSMYSLSIGAALLIYASSVSASSDERAQTLLKQVVHTYAAMNTISGEFAITQEGVGMQRVEMSGKFKAQKPNRYMIDSGGALPLRFVSDGKTVLTFIKPSNGYYQAPLDELSMNQTVSAVAPLTIFFNQHKLEAPDTPTRYVGLENWNGRAYAVVEQTLGPAVMRYYIGASQIVERIKVHLEQQGKAFDVDASISRVSCDSPMNESDFDVSPPKGAHAVEMPRNDRQPLQAGQAAPGFSLPQPSGGEITLSSVVKAHKAVLVTFWFYACATCREEFPRLAKLYRELRAEGVEIVAVNSFDDRDTILKYVKEAGLSFQIAMDDVGTKHFGVAKAYGISLYPTAYLIDGGGRVVARYVGFKETEIREALTRLGIRAGR